MIRSSAQRHPHLIVSSILGWPVNHADADAPVDDELTLARLGVLDEQLGARGESPIYVRFPLGTWTAAWLAVIGIMSRLVARDRTGVVGPGAHQPRPRGADPDDDALVACGHRRRCSASGMPKDNMRASLFECGDGRWIHIMPPAPDRHPADAGGLRRDGTGAGWQRERRARPIRACPAGPAGAPSSRRSSSGRPTSGLPTCGPTTSRPRRRSASGAILDRRAGPGERVRRSISTTPRPGRSRFRGLPLTLDPPMKVRISGAARRRPCGADLGREHRSRPRVGLAVVEISARRAEGARLRQLPRRPARTDAARRSRRHGGQGRGDDRRPDAVRRLALRRLPARQACRRARHQVARQPARPRRPARLGRRRPPQPAPAGGPAARARRRLGARGEPRRDLLPCQLVRAAGPPRRLAGLRPAVPGVVRVGAMGAGEGNPPMWHRFGFMDHLCAMSSVGRRCWPSCTEAAPGGRRRWPARCSAPVCSPTARPTVRADGSLAPYPILDAEQTMDVRRRADPALRRRLDRGRRPDRSDEVERLCAAVSVADADQLVDAAAARPAADLLAALAAAGVAAAAGPPGAAGRRSSTTPDQPGDAVSSRRLPPPRVGLVRAPGAPCGPSATSTSSSTAPRRCSASTPSRCSERSVCRTTSSVGTLLAKEPSSTQATAHRVADGRLGTWQPARSRIDSTGWSRTPRSSSSCRGTPGRSTPATWTTVVVDVQPRRPGRRRAPGPRGAAGVDERADEPDADHRSTSSPTT